jgi:ABC-type Na+ efflux pump permease subunit
MLTCVQISSDRTPRSYSAFEMAMFIAMAFAGAASFRRERQNGVLELLLVAPLRVDEIIHGRLRSLRKQFLPAVALTVIPLLVFLVWSGEGLSLWFDTATIVPQCLFLVSSLFMLPKLGLYYALRGERFLAAWALACLTGLGAPFILAKLLLNGLPDPASYLTLTAVWQLALGHIITQALHAKLHRSAIALQKG